jgi:hypothetical protein
MRVVLCLPRVIRRLILLKIDPLAVRDASISIRVVCGTVVNEVGLAFLCTAGSQAAGRPGCQTGGRLNTTVEGAAI